MELSVLTAISPVDGRYRSKAEPLAGYFSEYALIKYRVFVEIEYFIALCELPLPQLEGVDKTSYPRIREIYKNFTLENALRVKEIEKVTNHDVKAVEYFINGLAYVFKNISVGDKKLICCGRVRYVKIISS